MLRFGVYNSAMRLPTYSRDALRVAKLARCRAARLGAKTVEPEHLLLAMLGRSGMLRVVLTQLGIDAEEGREIIMKAVARHSRGYRSEPRLSARMEKVLFKAEDEALGLGSTAIKPEHLLLAVLRDEGPAAVALAQRGASYAQVRQTLRKLLHLPAPRKCPRCGYDLRATPERCPECGSVV